MTPNARITALVVAVSSGLSCGFETRGLNAPSREVDVSEAARAPKAGESARGSAGESGSSGSPGLDTLRADAGVVVTRDAGDDIDAPDAAPGDASMVASDAASPDLTDAEIPPADAGTEPCPRMRETVVVSATIVVGSGKTFDGGCKRYVAGSTLRSAAVAMPDKVPMFELEDRARIQNVVLDSSGVEGIHTQGDATVVNVVWERVGDEALAIMGEGTVEIEGGSAMHAPNAIITINASTTLRVSGLRASDANKLVRQNGGTTYQAVVVIDGCDVSVMEESIFRTDNSSSRVTMTNTRYSRIGGELFVGVSPRNVLMSGNREY